MLGKGWENGKRKTKDEMKKELDHWKPAGEAAIERNATPQQLVEVGNFREILFGCF